MGKGIGVWPHIERMLFLQGGSGNFSACFDVPILTVFVFYVFNDDI